MSAEPFTILTTRTVVLAEANIDTDQIIPARFLTTTTRHGLGRRAFHDWRYDADGGERAGCSLNAVDPASHRVLVAGDNFGCGSSREHAPWAILDFGFRAVISTGVADIFRSNALRTGLLPVIVEPRLHAELVATPGREVRIDLQTCELKVDDHVTRFEIDPFARTCLMQGVDALGYLLSRLAEIGDFERRAAA